MTHILDELSWRDSLHQHTDLAELRAHPELAGLRILQRGNRLSITPVEADEWDFILTLIGKA